MKYLCLLYHEESTLDALTEHEYDALMGELCAYDEELRQRGHAIVSSLLQPAHTATTLRVRSGRLSLSDGPCAATKEQLSGFYLIDARDLNEAILVASRMPPARLGCVEVRPIKELDRP